MRSLKLLLLFALALFGLAGPTPPSAYAGGWALTLLDPLPKRFEAGTSYTIGYWLLQHGTHPPQAEGLGTTGLRLEGPGGNDLTFSGVPLREPGHFAVAVAIPENGTWRVRALQGWFGEQEVGTLTVPGGLQRAKYDGQLPEAHDDHGKESLWGAVHPPGVDTVAAAAAKPAMHASQHATPPLAADAAARARDAGSSWVLVPLAALGLLCVASGVLLVRRRRPADRAG